MIQFVTTSRKDRPRSASASRHAIDRREALAGLSGLAMAATGFAAPAASHKFSPHILGANTAITGYGLFEAIRLLRRLGFKTIEVQNLDGVPAATPGQFPGFRIQDVSDDVKGRIKAAISGFDYVTTHLPYTGLEYTAPDGEAARAGVETLESALAATAFLGAKIGVIHPKPAPGKTLQEIWPVMIKRFRRWGDIAREGGFHLALETGYPLSVADFVRLVHEVDHEHVGATIDVGHQGRYRELTARVRPEDKATAAGIRAYNDINMELIDRLGAKLIHFHIHDIEPKSWREHKPLIHGFIDYPRLIAKLRETKYSGVLVFEIGGPAEEMPNFLTDAKRQLEQHLKK
ncbi:MAG: sugar phosphate isomerase/epimerase family protein [Pirellulaceae bacterium]|jgi:sugar phosphate isomerase/epimerase|nr:sugar phosphate isomerase/epimerase family protein [Pirellulaceae bacterium]